MEKRSELKRKARGTLKDHYFRSVMIVFICALLVGGGYEFTTKNIFEAETDQVVAQDVINQKLEKKSNADVVNEMLNRTEGEIQQQEQQESYFNNGVLSVVFNSITASGSFLFGVLNACNHFFFQGNVSVFVLLLVGAAISFLYFLFVQNIIGVGMNRYFLEHRKYKETSGGKLFFPYQVKKAFHLASILGMRTLYLVLWSFTIIGGIIKHYSYLMIPYILAENPNISRKEAFLLSRKMMQGEKWNVFKLDFSFIGWNVLGVLTFNLSNLFYFGIYREAIYAELYMDLRKKAKEEKIEHVELLNDTLLVEGCESESYPEDKFSIPIEKRRNWLNIDYDRNYTIRTLILFFFTFSMIGWIWEVSLHLFSDGTFVNRGTMFGPWLPIYGTGGVLILVLLKPFRKHPWLTFIFAMVLCGVIEYTTAWFLETFRHMKWWDYSGYFLNIQGRVCLEGLLVFGLGGCGFVYVAGPILDNIYQKISTPIKTTLCALLIVLFAIDMVYSHFHPNMGEGITHSKALPVEYEYPINMI